MSDLIVPGEIDEILNRAPVKMGLIDTDKYTVENRLSYVTVPNIFEPNSKMFHPKGLFSEEIFGDITSMERFTTEAALDLHTTIIHPMIFKTIIQPKALYTSVMAGKQYAVFDEETSSFKLADFHTPNSGTGFQFFITHLRSLADAPTPEALRASNLHKLLVKYRDQLTTSKLIILPAGIRDLDAASGRLSNDDINKLYMAVINLASSLSSYALSEDTIFDGIRYQIQVRVADVFSYLMNIIEGKGGFLQKHYGARKIAYTTRNVISVSINEADTPDSPVNIKADETMVPMLNLIKCFQPFFTNVVLKKLYGELFVHGSTENVPVTNPKNFMIEYVTLKSSEINRYTTPDGVNRVINQFNHVGFRESPVSITDIKGNRYWLILTYEHAGKIYIAKTGDDLRAMVEREKHTFDAGLIKPLRWVEFMYIFGLHISKGKHGLITRYPVLEDGSIYASKLHLITTNPSVQRTLVFDSGMVMEVPHFPVPGKPYFESLIVHPSRLSGLGADYDGDTVSFSTIWTKEGNAEIAEKLTSVEDIIGSDMKLKVGATKDIVELAIFNLSRQDVVAEY